jgi:hypothetical protein
VGLQHAVYNAHRMCEKRIVSFGWKNLGQFRVYAVASEDILNHFIDIVVDVMIHDRRRRRRGVDVSRDLQPAHIPRQQRKQCKEFSDDRLCSVRSLVTIDCNMRSLFRPSSR